MVVRGPLFISALFFIVLNFWIITGIVSFCSNALLNLEKSISNTFSRRSHVKPQRTDDYDCTLCLKLLYEPITTPCGHSFCRSCLFQTMDRGVMAFLLLLVSLSPVHTELLFEWFWYHFDDAFFLMHILYFVFQAIDVLCVVLFYLLVPGHVQSG